MTAPLPRRVQIVEVGPRDGLQNEAAQVPTAEKIAFVNRLADAGLSTIEVSAFVSPKRVPQMADAADVFAGITRRPGVSYTALVPNLKGLEAEEFPAIPTIDEATADARQVTFASAELRTAIQQVAFAAAPDDTRPVLAGVLLEVREARATLVAADGFRLAITTIDLAEPVAEPWSAIIPAATLVQLARAIGDLDEPVTVTMTPNGGQVVFHTESLDLTARLIDGPTEFHRLQRGFGFEMDIRHNRYRAAALAKLRDDVLQVGRVLDRRRRDADELATDLDEFKRLLQALGRIHRVAREHGLLHDRVVAANDDPTAGGIADNHFARLAAFEEPGGFTVAHGYLAGAGGVNLISTCFDRFHGQSCAS